LNGRWLAGAYREAMSDLHLIIAPVAPPDAALPTIELHVERRTLAKRLWRGVAADGKEFGFELEAPLKHGDTIYQAASLRYVIAQQPEALLAVELAGLPNSAVAGIGWAVGNLHLELSSDPARLLMPDEPAARQLLDRIQVDYTLVVTLFRAGRFARNHSVNELGPSHKH